ncbi:MAG: monofunctional biosynthetic peptidoglycan transglycosylase [Acidobacteria bacterium]|nr:monofunctional biosynthetic peptidoglycan transglycosylase [Acidobacteriota bacterium]
MRRPTRKRGLLVRIVRALLVAVVGYYVLCVALLFAYRVWDPPITGVQIERRLQALVSGADYEPKQRQVKLSEIPLDFQHAVIAAEDGAFYAHHGVDWAEIRLVVEEAREGERFRGGSTISQQLVKNLFLTTSRSPVRKVLELALVFPAEAILPKDRILEIYLNVIEWGPGVWGAEAASEYHYGKPASKLSREEAARLAACIPAPRSRKPSRMNEYSAIIRERMRSRGW